MSASQSYYLISPTLSSLQSGKLIKTKRPENVAPDRQTQNTDLKNLSGIVTSTKAILNTNSNKVPEKLVSPTLKNMSKIKVTEQNFKPSQKEAQISPLLAELQSKKLKLTDQNEISGLVKKFDQSDIFDKYKIHNEITECDGDNEDFAADFAIRKMTNTASALVQFWKDKEGVICFKGPNFNGRLS